MSERHSNLSALQISQHPAYATTKWNLQPDSSGFVNVAESRPGGPFPLWYEIHGHGPLKVVWIMGLGGTRNLWKRQTRYFGHENGDRYSCLVFDNRGVGKTATPNCRYNTTEMAKDILDLLRQIGWLDSDSPHYPNDINIAGISLGGMIAQELALLIPQRVQSLILIGTAPRLIRTAPIHSHVLQRILMFLPTGVDSELDHKARRIFSKSFLEAPDNGSLDPNNRFPNNHDRFVAEDLAEREESDGLVRRKGIVLQAIAAGWHHRSSEELGKIGDLVGRSRIMVMHGTHDETIAFSHVDFFKVGFGDGPEYHVFEECGHIPMWERETEFNTRVAEFIYKSANL
ncbi:alpha/beta hydrolase (glycylpeptide N-tetradecanoyltransferase) [Colletotrichum truncatum]|uniref:Alpha/beta hydrolase (Glycylpeptide N-tetradecanoyltransferase) n=1 Tax=Colletotrichum truncatum TaxID=5467 RepID=A0ACC3YPW3_COLTU|nr:alpha/beta hydrolase (glycylpeptide N-tetradecanoyltransferase) [Colletotrichum truncatum]KAF6792107.1 alpha/beta hydrolase (glycylpeptide N-tetradecanoyltransferase) [Colletotrichum truncatum]